VKGKSKEGPTSAATAADSVAIQLLENVAVVGAASVLGLAILEAIGLAILAGILALAALGGAYALRRDRALQYGDRDTTRPRAAHVECGGDQPPLFTRGPSPHAPHSRWARQKHAR